MSAETTREQIVEAADELFYRQGYEHTSFADIAGMVRISRGNFYYHFKAKDEILDAVIALRVTRTRDMLDRWEADGADPADRIRSFIRILIANRTKIMAYGCPVGTLCAELAKLDHVARQDANGIFALFRDWLRRQFELLGLADEADALALHILARSQGVAALANAFHDEEFIRSEVDSMTAWLDARIATS
ncbi:TetR/AcrR family transcriptional regulator [Kaustia mangrovi]|uniref:TetR/AcrR family transcriptional regulator n=1 Tax=Kaustia mangrovi TaxID=2593653 RepID=A0A7S8HC62_9HYPH|nr:TetR/AcrR family transcriptional regulator [Kaustia mangrovi]QPC43377.1 TetR/AcrR family transcriptional regulator [Kaustia mangrovi]